MASFRSPAYLLNIIAKGCAFTDLSASAVRATARTLTVGDITSVALARAAQIFNTGQNLCAFLA